MRDGILYLLHVFCKALHFLLQELIVDLLPINRFSKILVCFLEAIYLVLELLALTNLKFSKSEQTALIAIHEAKDYVCQGGRDLRRGWPMFECLVKDTFEHVVTLLDQCQESLCL